MNNLHDWVFHHNQYTNLWYAIPRESYNQYWSDNNLKEVLKSKSIDSLISLINKTNGDMDAINKLTNGST